MGKKVWGKGGSLSTRTKAWRSRGRERERGAERQRHRQRQRQRRRLRAWKSSEVGFVRCTKRVKGFRAWGLGVVCDPWEEGEAGRPERKPVEPSRERWGALTRVGGEVGRCVGNSICRTGYHGGGGGSG